jgi:uncharacterized RmlC-like cupin family protein
MIDLLHTVPKGWGQERIWANESGYCGKFLDFDQGARFSMHFHAVKDETWYVLTGRFRVIWIDTHTSQEHSDILRVGDVWHNPPLLPHQLVCEETGTIVEVSTHDDPNDNYRVRPGDSQCATS